MTSTPEQRAKWAELADTIKPGTSITHDPDVITRLVVLAQAVPALLKDIEELELDAEYEEFRSDVEKMQAAQDKREDALKAEGALWKTRATELRRLGECLQLGDSSQVERDWRECLASQKGEW
jgi:hypothetical protein